MLIEFRTTCSKCGKEIIKTADRDTEEQCKEWLKMSEERFGHGAYCEECYASKRGLMNRMGKGYLR